VRTQRTRSYHINVPRQENQAEIFYTLLGIETEIGKYRFSCPDLSTARSLQVLREHRLSKRGVFRMTSTKLSTLADELEIAWHKTILAVRGKKRASAAASARGRMRPFASHPKKFAGNRRNRRGADDAEFKQSHHNSANNKKSQKQKVNRHLNFTVDVTFSEND
jgi:hypothetical protein